ncbi:MAG: methyltransferase domain-containing protein [Bacteroidales bacterium]
MPVISRQGLLIGIPTLGRPINLNWAMAFKALNPPINYNTQTIIIKNRPVDEARNAICEYAIKNDFKYVFFLGDDVVPPGHTLSTLIFRMEQFKEIGVCGGVYCTKGIPSFPLVFRGNGSGSYWDWKVGEFFEVTGLGMDCTLIRVDVLKNLPQPWFKTVDTDKFLDAEPYKETWTEDLYFCKNVLENTSYKIYVDASILCEHWDTINNKVYTVNAGSLPTQRLNCTPPRLLDIGCGYQPYEDDTYNCVHVDIIDAPHVDYRCDIRSLPFANEEFDAIRAWHVLEHFGRNEVDDVFAEWLRVLKHGGKVILCVPDISWAIANINSDRKAALNVLYGAQDTEYDFHKIGFTRKHLIEFLKSHKCKDISISKQGYNLKTTAIKE